MMKDVYANSSINICASAAADSSEASFQRRDLSMLSPLDVEPQWTGLLDCDDIESELGPLPAYLQRIKFKLVNTSMYESDLSNAPLNLRAWVFQERILSRRHLYMTCNQLWWECRGMCACEVFPAGIPDRLDPSRTDTDEGYRVQYYALGGHRHHSIDNGAALDSSSAGQRKRVTQGELARHAPFSGPSEVDMYELWNRLVERYSQCNITYSSDKLPALSGLAKSFSILQGSGFALNGQSYLAGVWRPYLPEALYWKPKPPLRGDVPFGRNRPHPYRAPSWSWSSVESPVEWINSGQFTEPACRVEDAKVLHLDERYEAGMVKGGILHLRSRLIGPFTYEESPLMNLTPSPALDSRVRVALCSAEKECVTCWDERDFDSQKWCISYLDPLPDTVHEDGILNGTETVRKTVSLEASAKDPRIRLFLVPLFQRWGFAGVILCQVVVDETDLECADDKAVFQRVGSFAYMEIEKKVLDLIPERTIAII
ncbi:hypothetical protein B0T09DRAFT_268002 [Sordaria sp. MPI-SDFR-AT-0083]|nr:hypothetical protein B0T09DRAFT_268002 [Sordaria sp. MPI-SDFR-AT-0083]